MTKIVNGHDVTGCLELKIEITGPLRSGKSYMVGQIAKMLNALMFIEETGYHEDGPSFERWQLFAPMFTDAGMIEEYNSALENLRWAK